MSGRARSLLAASVGLVVAVVAVYGQVVDHAFVSYDDPGYILKNPHVSSGLTWEGVRWAFTESRMANWHPLTWISHMVDVELFGSDAGGHHAMSAALHALNAVLLMLVLVRMTRTTWPCVAVAALFALHPLRVESVAWAAERKDVLAGTFWMVTLLAYERYARERTPARYAAVALSMAAGLMAKPTVVTLPFVLLLLDAWPLRRAPGLAADGAAPADRTAGPGETWTRLIAEKVPLLLLSVGSVGATVWSQTRGGAVQTLENMPLVERVAHAPVAYLAYLRKAVWPDDLAFFYPHPGAPTAGALAVALVVLLALTAAVAVAVLRGRRERDHLAVGWLWFLGTLVPVIGVVQVGSQAFADRYAYLPLVGIETAVVLQLAAWARRSPRLRASMAALAVVVLGALGWTAWRQVAVWHDSRSLYAHAVAVTEDNDVALNNLGSTLLRRDEPEEALRHLEEAVRLRPTYVKAHENRGAALAALGRFDEAVESYRSALAIAPEAESLHAALGSAYLRLGDIGPALEHHERAAALANESFEAVHRLAATLVAAGDLDAATRRFRQAVKLRPNSAPAHNNLGTVLAQRGRVDEAIAHFERALEIRPDHEDARNNLEKLRRHR